MNLYTIGFTQSTAEHFFERLRAAGVRRVIDIRLKPDGQLAGFARRADLPYFLDRLAAGCAYLHRPDLAPTDEIMKTYRGGGSPAAFHAAYNHLLDQRGIPAALETTGLPRAGFEAAPSCLLCSEAEPDNCHRRLLAERIAREWGGVEIVHL